MATTSPTLAPAAEASASALARASSTAAFRALLSAGLPCDSWNVIPVVRFAPAAVAVSMVSPAFDRSCRVTVIWFWAWYPVTAVPFESYVGYRLTSAAGERRSDGRGHQGAHRPRHRPFGHLHRAGQPVPDVRCRGR